MSKKVNLKQKIFLIFVILLIVISLFELNYMFLDIAHSEPNPNDDIFETPLNGLIVYFVLGYASPHFASLPVLLHSGLYSLQTEPFSKAKCLHSISFKITLILTLLYAFLFGLIICPILPMVVKDVLNFIFFSTSLFLIASLALITSIVLDIIGTILYKRDKKRQLKSTDS